MNTKAIGTAWRVTMWDGCPSEIEVINYFSITEKDIYVAKNKSDFLKENLPLGKIENVCLKSDYVSFFLKKEDLIAFVTTKLENIKKDLFSKIEDLKYPHKIVE
ncbi:MAG: hypothetical protein ACPG5B_06865 [Chitinophagales bacterium]